MKAAKVDRVEEDDPGSWRSSLRLALSEILLEAMSAVPKATMEETVRKWLARARAPEDSAAQDDLFAEAAALSLELAIHAPSFTGVRPIDRLARKSGERPREHALASQWLTKSQFRLFRLVARRPDDVHEALDLASGKTFLIFEHRFAPSAAGIDLAARICPFPEGLHVLAGPLIPLGVAGVGAIENYVRPGKGIGNDQRCAQHVYRDYIRAGAPAGLKFGLAALREPVRLSNPDEELDSFVRDWLEVGDGPTPTGDALAEARELTSAKRIICALLSCVETGAGGFGEFAAVYRALAHIQMETLHLRARVGSGEPEPLAVLRGGLAEQAQKGKFSREALALYEELALAIEGRPKARPRADDDLTRVIERIRALRAKTTDQGCTEHEALRAAEKVAELLERYGLSLSEIDIRKQTCEGFGIDTGRRKREPVDRCTPAIAEFCDCRVWSESTPTGAIRYVFFGLPADVEAARYLYDLVGIAFTSETVAFKGGPLYREMGGVEKRGAVSSFQIGLAGGIAEKLMKLKAQRMAAMFASSGRDLVPVKASILDEEIEKLGLSFQNKRGRRRRKVVAAAYADGQAAGGRFEVHPGLK